MISFVLKRLIKSREQKEKKEEERKCNRTLNDQVKSDMFCFMNRGFRHHMCCIAWVKGEHVVAFNLFLFVT